MKNFFLKLSDIPATTVGRVITLILAMANEIVAVIGASTFCDTPWYPIVSTVVMVLVAVWNAWKNNSFTWFAAASDRFYDAMNDGKLTQEEIDDIIQIISNAEDRKNEDNVVDTSDEDDN